MPQLKNYEQFSGRHWETGSVHHALAYQGITTPHNNQPISEALLLGISGGITFGYFTFDYEGYDPILALLTRNTFDPLDTILERLAIPQNIHQTSKPDKAEANLIEILENGDVPIVWADTFSLPYNALPYDEGMWGMMPIVVFGYDGEIAHIADRSSQGLTISAEALAAARGRVKKDKFRILTLDSPNMDKLPPAVQKGIFQCIQLFTEKPPKGTRDNFGFAAMQKWAKMLTNIRNKQSWERYFPAGSRLYAALTGGYDRLEFFGSTGKAERNLYADFLDEAALVLQKPDLQSVAGKFRHSAKAWHGFTQALLPEDVSLLAEVRQLMDKRHQLFIKQGSESLSQIRQINDRLRDIKQLASNDFPMSPDEIITFRENLRDHVLAIHDIEFEAIEMLEAVMN